MNQYIVNEPQAKAINDGASLLIVKIGKLQQSMLERGGYLDFSVLPLKQGDEIFIAEEFQFYGNGIHILYKADKDYKDVNEWRSATEMTSEISRFKCKVGKVSVKRVQDITDDEILSIGITRNTRTSLGYSAEVSEETFNLNQLRNTFKIWLKDQGIDYSANPWVALAELKKEIK